MLSESSQILSQLPEQKSLVMFDGYCNLCNGAVQFIIKRDPKSVFYFAALSWPISQCILREHSEFRQKDSILLFNRGKLYSESSAALMIAGRLRHMWPLMKIFWIIPKFIRDVVYRWIARNRYSWFGKKDFCMLPEPEMAKRFLDGTPDTDNEQL